MRPDRVLGPDTSNGHSTEDQVVGLLSTVAHPYLTLEEASELTGILSARLRSMALRKAIPYRGSQRDPLFSVDTVESLLRRSIIAPEKLVPASGSVRPAVKPRKFEFNRVLVGNVLDIVRQMPSSSVQAIVTSPPFWGQRVYEDETAVGWADGAEVAFGREPTPEAYVAHSLQILGALGRVLKPAGTIWWNLGDSYMTRTIARVSSRDRILHYAGKRTAWANNPFRRNSSNHPYLKDKDLTLVPFQVAIGAQLIGYWVRSIIVWSKQHTTHQGEETGSRAHVPEVVADRPVVGHEYILLLSKDQHYDYYPDQAGDRNGDGTPLNVRTVWSFKPVDKRGTHGARFPQQLPRRCIQLATKRRQVVFDPFAGSGNTLIAAKALDRRFFGSDISPTYVAQARQVLGLQDLEPAAQGQGPEQLGLATKR